MIASLNDRAFLSCVLLLCACAVPATAQECLDCHAQPGTSVAFPNGQTRDVTIPKEAWDTSVHGSVGIGCTDCHSEIKEYPHPELAARSSRDYTLSRYTVCQQCHEENFKKQMDGVHLHAIAAGNKDAAVCSDCHDPHRQRKLTSEDGKLLPEGRVWVSKTCGHCHGAIAAAYEKSAHGSALVGEGNLDVPTCTSCHGVHDIQDPTTNRFRLSSPKLCANCHTDRSLMEKYGLSTRVLETYVADFHGRTVTLFSRRHPDQDTNKPVCYDCHGHHDVVKVDDPSKGLHVKANLLRTCQKCHPGATEAFPDSWLSHYIPDKEKTPLVYWADRFYEIVIPATLGGMGLFVLSDALRRAADRRRRRATARKPGGAPPADGPREPGGEA